ncbi:40S ribosomal protein S6 [Galemys pyrenaicus]|uniref:Small ribosomal subunit protein eS6 n=1 Tax=Galemys pyrenaicus TaxID=202257 RepID=A0A8J6AR14_GALPY|nr:40S ribosomal protein S6 [Galemys pyrenaicus]
MKLDISFPDTGCQKHIEVDHECKLHTFFHTSYKLPYLISSKLLLLVWVKNGRVMCSESLAEATVFPHQAKCLDDPKQLAESGNPSISKEDDILQYAVIAPKQRSIALKKQWTKKNKEDVSPYTKLLAKRMKETKEKCQEQITKTWGLSSLKASTSESSQK